jgi:tRNA modification GTPase
MLISAKENKGINELLDIIKDKFISNEVKINTDIVITNSRHKEAVDKTISSLKNIEKSTIEGMPLDMVSIDLQNALSFLGEILGENVSEDIINGIFSKFCLGK